MPPPLLFGFNQREDVYAGLRQRVKLLKGALQKPDGYNAIIQNSEETLHDDQVFQIRNKCALALITMKYHAEFAIEGIEYL